MGMKSKRKGCVGEREIASIIREYGYDARRGVQYHGGTDSPDVVGLPGIHIEVKRTERLSLYDAMAQAIHDCGSNIPVVMHRKNNCEWVAIMRLSDFMEIYNGTELPDKEVKE